MSSKRPITTYNENRPVKPLEFEKVLPEVILVLNLWLSNLLVAVITNTLFAIRSNTKMCFWSCIIHLQSHGSYRFALI